MSELIEDQGKSFGPWPLVWEQVGASSRVANVVGEEAEGETGGVSGGQRTNLHRYRW